MSTPSHAPSTWLDPEGRGTSPRAITHPHAREESGDAGLSLDEIAARAYEKWEGKGRPPGTQLQDWLEAEAEVSQVRDLARRLARTNSALHDTLDECKRVEEALRLSEERTRLILDTAYDAFIALSEDGRITDWNRQAEATFGWSRQEALGRSLAETIVPAQHRAAHEQGLRQFQTTGEGRLLNRRV